MGTINTDFLPPKIADSYKECVDNLVSDEKNLKKKIKLVERIEEWISQVNFYTSLELRLKRYINNSENYQDKWEDLRFLDMSLQFETGTGIECQRDEVIKMRTHLSRKFIENFLQFIYREISRIEYNINMALKKYNEGKFDIEYKFKDMTPDHDPIEKYFDSDTLK